MRIDGVILLMFGILAGCAHAPDEAVAQPAPSPAAAPRPAAPPRDLASVVRALPAELAQITDEEALGALGRRIADVPGVRSADLNRRGWSRTIMIDPMDAETALRLLGLGEAYIVSPDVHQRSWTVVVRDGDEAVDRHGHRRVQAQAPRFGAWVVRLAVDGRPAGPLPGLYFGPSPAYPLAGTGATVTSIAIDRSR